MGDLAILAYHSLDTSGSVVSVAPHVFARQMACAAELGFRGVSMRDAVAQRAADGTWPERSVVVTFDDGFANLNEEALPVLRRHGFAATVFLVSEYMGRSNLWETPPAGLGTRPVLGWQQAEELAGAGWEIGSHTRTHPDLRNLSSARLEDEIAGSRAALEQRLGVAVESFAYPYGRYDARAETVAAREYTAACTTRLSRAGDESLFGLPRVDAYYLKDERAVRRLLTGKLDHYLTLRRWGRAVRRTLAGDPVAAKS